MDQQELEAMKEKRLAELKDQYQDSMGDPSQRAQQEEAQRKQAEMKQSILSQILDQEARARLNNISLTKPDKAKAVESMLIQMAQSGQIVSKLNEAQLKGLLEKLSQQSQRTTVKFDRRRAALDSDSDEY